MGFWIAAILLICLALALVLPALLGRGRTAGVTRDELNITVYRDRLEELKGELANGTLSEAQFGQARAELARALLQDLPGEDEGATQMTVPAQAAARWAAVITALAVPLLGVWLYLELDARTLLMSVPPGENTEQAQAAARRADQLMARVKANPADDKAWLELGRTYPAMGRPDAAAQAYDKAAQTGGESADLLVAKAHALSRLRGGNLAGEPEKLITRALELDPDGKGALTWGGMLAYQRGEYAQAIAHWERLLKLVPKEDPLNNMLQGLLDTARARNRGEAVATAPHGAPATGAAGGITVAVTLDKSVRDGAQPDDTVYVMANAVNGPKMPLAVAKARISDLPMTVELNDSMGMMPNTRLSDFKKIVLLARVSRAGTPVPRNGDLFGQTDAIANPPGEQPVQLAINRVVKLPPGTTPPPGATATPAPAPEASAPRPAPAGSGALKVTASLDPALRGEVRLSDSVFIFARAASGPKMPLAAVKRAATDLPVTVTLDDSMAMAPQFKLSSFPEVVVVVRVSKTGDVIAKSGDLFGETAPISVKDAGAIEVMINQQVP
ncbi:MAG: c-type cytochrome biogenesis protein CcmI [Pseudomonadota bacterium]|nr:MAG: c-type cytochrome biogenesis protein CcmI [Pseudomonadota bacterium]